MIQCLCKGKSLQAMHNLTWPMERYSLPVPVYVYQIQNSPKRRRWPFLFHGTQDDTSRFSRALGASLQHHVLIAWPSPLLSQLKTPLLLKNSTDTQTRYGEDVCVTRDCRNTATSQANISKFKQNPNSPTFTFGTHQTAKKEENFVWIVLTFHLLGFWAVYTPCTFYKSTYRCAQNTSKRNQITISVSILFWRGRSNCHVKSVCQSLAQLPCKQNSTYV